MGVRMPAPSRPSRMSGVQPMVSSTESYGRGCGRVMASSPWWLGDGNGSAAGTSWRPAGHRGGLAHNGSLGAAARAAESRAAYPLVRWTVEDSTTWPAESTNSRSSTEPLIPCMKSAGGYSTAGSPSATGGDSAFPARSLPNSRKPPPLRAMHRDMNSHHPGKQQWAPTLPPSS